LIYNFLQVELQNTIFKKKSIITIPRDKIKPPNAKSVSSAKDPKVLATIMFLPAAAINRNSADAIWLISKSRKYCLKSLKKKIERK
jgi:hypothetical protein